MGFLKGRRILVTGMLSNRSIAYGIAKACHREGAELAFTYQGEGVRDRTVDLAHEFGTPLFVYDEEHLRARCREAVAAFPDGVAYATKAFLCLAMAQLAHEEGMHLDVATRHRYSIVDARRY